jgi:hypothetical protein
MNFKSLMVKLPSTIGYPLKENAESGRSVWCNTRYQNGSGINIGGDVKEFPINIFWHQEMRGCRCCHHSPTRSLQADHGHDRNRRRRHHHHQFDQ